MTTTDPDYLALLRGVLESPLSDMPRIVLCDWLDEHAGTVPCHWCNGSGIEPRPQPFQHEDGNTYHYVGPDGPCAICHGRCTKSDGNAERAEFIRLEIALSHFNQIKCEVNARPEKYPYGCGKCDFCRLQIACEDFHDTPSKWLQIFHDLPFGYSHTSRHPGFFSYDPFPAIFTRRGFVGSIRLTAEQFMQHAAELFREHPITEVVLSNVSPAFWQASNTSHYKDDYFFVIGLTITFGDHWHTNNNDRHIIDSEIWEALDGHTIDNSPRVNAKRYPTRELALAALSDACVRYGRRLAGLPEEYQQ